MRSILGRNFLWIQSQGGEYPIKGTVRGLAQWVHLRPNPVLATEKKFSPFHFISRHETPHVSNYIAENL